MRQISEDYTPRYPGKRIRSLSLSFVSCNRDEYLLKIIDMSRGVGGGGVLTECSCLEEEILGRRAGVLIALNSSDRCVLAPKHPRKIFSNLEAFYLPSLLACGLEHPLCNVPTNIVYQH